MKNFPIYVWALALLGIGAAQAAGQFPGYPQATSSPTTGNTTTLPLTGNELIPADTQLPGGVNPQTEVISTSQLRAYALSGSSVSTYMQVSVATIATLPTCAAALNGAQAVISNGVAYSLTLAAAGAPGSAVSSTGTVTRGVMCGSTDQSSFAWVYR